MSKFSSDKFLFLMVFLFLIRLSQSNNHTYKIPFGLYLPYKDCCIYKKDNLIKNIFVNYLYVNLSIGTPPQILPFHLDINSQTFYVSHNFFNRTASSTYELISQNETKYSYENAISGYNSRDFLNINNVKKKINFIFETKHNKDNDIGCIGLLIPTKIQKDVYSFSSSLIKAKLINSFIWTLKFNKDIDYLDFLLKKKENDIIGELIIGNFPHNYEEDKEIYNEAEYYETKALWTENQLNWDIHFDSIYIKLKDDQKKLNKDISQVNIPDDRDVVLNPDIAYILGPTHFFHFINRFFFYKFRNICSSNRIEGTLFRVIQCQNNDLFNISSFPDIYFELGDIIFNLTYKDVFILDKKFNQYNFLILQEGYIGNWNLGRIFLRKYQFIFNEQNKTVGYYKSMNVITKEDKWKIYKNKIIGFIVSFFQIIFIIGIILFVIYEIYTNFIVKKMKKRINELDDNLNNSDLLEDKKDIN